MKKKNIGIGFALVLLVGILGTAFFVWQKPGDEKEVTNGSGEQVVAPLTLEEAENLEIDTSDWKTYTSEDGAVTFKYPDRVDGMHPVTPDMQISFFPEVPESIIPNIEYFYGFSGSYFPIEAFHNEEIHYDIDPIGIGIVVVFDANLTVDEVAKRIAEEYRPTTGSFDVETKEEVIEDQTYQVVKLVNDLHDVSSVHYLMEDSVGRVNLVQIYSGTWGTLAPLVVLEVQEQVVREITKTVQTN